MRGVGGGTSTAPRPTTDGPAAAVVRQRPRLPPLPPSRLCCGPLAAPPPPSPPPRTTLPRRPTAAAVAAVDAAVAELLAPVVAAALPRLGGATGIRGSIFPRRSGRRCGRHHRYGAMRLWRAWGGGRERRPRLGGGTVRGGNAAERAGGGELCWGCGDRNGWWCRRAPCPGPRRRSRRRWEWLGENDFWRAWSIKRILHHPSISHLGNFGSHLCHRRYDSR